MAPIGFTKTQAQVSMAVSFPCPSLEPGSSPVCASLHSTVLLMERLSQQRLDMQKGVSSFSSPKITH